MKPIFIAGIGRTGTTITHEIFCEHENVAWLSRVTKNFPDVPAYNRTLMNAVDYPILGPYLKKKVRPGEYYEFWERHCPGFSRTCRDLVRQDVTAKSRDSLRRMVSEFVTPKWSRFMAKYTGWPRFGYLHDIFDDAKFIHVSRDGRAVVSSFLQTSWWRGWRGPQNWFRPPLTATQNKEWEKHGRSYVALASIEWKILTDAYEEARSVNKDAEIFELKYEDLCADTLTTLRRLIDFCELPWTANFENAVRDIRIKSTNHKWREVLSQDQQDIMANVLESHLKRYDYV
jgi:hypothetical protein